MPSFTNGPWSLPKTPKSSVKRIEQVHGVVTSLGLSAAGKIIKRQLLLEQELMAYKRSKKNNNNNNTLSCSLYIFPILKSYI